MTKKKTVTLLPLQHRDNLQIMIKFLYRVEVAEELKLLPGIAWSETQNCYYMLLTWFQYRLIF